MKLEDAKMFGDNKEKIIKSCNQTDNLLMKPFALGWTREVVNRVITKNRNLNCDIYYFTPSGKKIRSLTEIRANLSDGLTPECFSFKRQPLGIDDNYETVRDARVKKKGSEFFNGNLKSRRPVKKISKTEIDEESDSSSLKKQKIMDSPSSKNLSEVKVKKEEEIELPKKDDGNEVNYEKVEKKKIERSKRIRNMAIHSTEEKRLKYNKKTKTKADELSPLSGANTRRAALKKVIAAKQAKQTKVTASKKILKKIIRKKVAGSPKCTVPSAKSDKETGQKNKNAKTKINLISKNTKKPLKRQQTKSKLDDAKEEPSTNETDKKSSTRDLRSIVKKNIGKYREMREKQKLANKSQIKSCKSRIAVPIITRNRSEPISKNKQLYLKPLEKGWRRELVFRTNCARAGQHADVYYFHPNGKKLRSCREVAENLTHGLTLEYFTFRKEPIGCGEPSEIIRKARSNTKSLQ